MVLFLRGTEETSDDGRGAAPFIFFLDELFLAGWSQRVVLGAAIVFRGAPLRANPTHLLEFQQRRIDGALVEFEQVAADLFDAPGDSVTVQRPERLECFENQQ